MLESLIDSLPPILVWLFAVFCIWLLRPIYLDEKEGEEKKEDPEVERLQAEVKRLTKQIRDADLAAAQPKEENR